MTIDWFIVVVILIVRSQGCCQSPVLSSIPSWPQGSLLLWLFGQASLTTHTALSSVNQWGLFWSWTKNNISLSKIWHCHITAWPTMSKNKAVNWEITGLDSLPSEDYYNHDCEPCRACASISDVRLRAAIITTLAGPGKYRCKTPAWPCPVFYPRPWPVRWSGIETWAGEVTPGPSQPLLANEGQGVDTVHHQGRVISARYISWGGEISLQGVNSLDNELKTL